MLQNNYQGYNTQNKHHAEFERRIEAIKEEYDKFGPTEEFVKKTANEIWKWYKNHISTCDKEFAEYLKAKNLVKIEKEADDTFNELLEGLEK